MADDKDIKNENRLTTMEGRLKNIEEILKDYHNQYASQLYFYDDFEYGELSADWIRLSGKFEVTPQGLECVETGKIYINYDQKQNATIDMKTSIEHIVINTDALPNNRMEIKNGKLILSPVKGECVRCLKIYKGVKV